MPTQTAYAVAKPTERQAVPRITAAGSWDGVISAYLVEVAQRTGSKRTPTEYRQHIARFREHVCPDLNEVTSAHVHAFGYAALPRRLRNGMLIDGVAPSPSTTVVRLAALYGLFDFARRQGMIERNPADDIKRPHLLPPVPKGLSRAQIRALLEAIPNTPGGWRDRAIVIVMLLTGSRREEVIGMRAGDLSEAGNGVMMFTSRVKGGRVRNRELPKPAHTAILEALHKQGRTLNELAPNDHLFDVASISFYQNLKRYGVKAGLAGLTPHTLRHTAAKIRRETGASIEDVQALLGHANIATTARYLAQLEGSLDPGWQDAAAAIGL